MARLAWLFISSWQCLGSTFFLSGSGSADPDQKVWANAMCELMLVKCELMLLVWANAINMR